MVPPGERERSPISGEGSSGERGPEFGGPARAGSCTKPWLQTVPRTARTSVPRSPRSASPWRRDGLRTDGHRRDFLLVVALPDVVLTFARRGAAHDASSLEVRRARRRPSRRCHLHSMACDLRAQYPELALRKQLGNMALEADRAGGWLSGRRLPTSRPSSLQLSFRSLGGRRFQKH